MKGIPHAYPTKQHVAYELLLNWQNGDPPTKGLGKDPGDGHRMTFRQEEQDNDRSIFRRNRLDSKGADQRVHLDERVHPKVSITIAPNKPLIWP